MAFPRSPLVTAQIAWDLQAQSGGRFVLGLGSQVKGHIERRFGVPWSAPVARMREYVQALRAIWRCWEKGEPLRFEGEHYRLTLMTPEFSPRSTGLPEVPVTISAVGPDMLRMAGRICDGVRLHGFCTRRYLEGFYGSTRTYGRVFELHGLQDLSAKLHRLSVEGRWKDMAREVPDDVLDLFVASGPYDRIARAIEERFGGLTDVVTIGFPSRTPQELQRDLIQDLKRIRGRS